MWLVLASSHTKPVGWWLVTHRRHRDEQGMGKAGLWMGVCGFHGGVWCEMTVRWCLWCVWMTKQPHTKAFKAQREKEKKEGKVIEGRSGKREGTGSERKRRYLVDPASSHMLVLKIKPCMPEYRWTKNRDCGWLIKSVRISLVKRGMRRITLLIVELIQEKDIGWCGVYCTGPIAFISSVFVVVCDFSHGVTCG